MEKTNKNLLEYNSKDVLKFISASFVGVFLFLIPIPKEKTFTIFVGVIIDKLQFVLSKGPMDYLSLLLFLFISISLFCTIFGFFSTKNIIYNREINNIFRPKGFYLFSRIVGILFYYMIYFNIGPEYIIGASTGEEMLGVSKILISVVFIIAFAMPLLTDFGIMEFVGVLVQKFVRFIFTCPGRSAIDLMTSWLGASSAGALLTVRQFELGYYSTREALTITTNFSLVSIPFCFVISKIMKLEGYFTIWYVCICITCFVLAIIVPRLWPLRSIPNTYNEGVGDQSAEIIPEGYHPVKWGLYLSSKKASHSSVSTVVRSGLYVYCSVFLDLIPLVIAWGTIMLAVIKHTPVFQIVSIPFGYYMQLLGIEDAMKLSSSVLVGFGDMYIPPLLLANEPSLSSRFILGVVTTSQIIYLTEIGAIILKSPMKVNIFQLFIIFIERTIIALPIAVILFKLFL